jgi:YcxB-like protein
LQIAISQFADNNIANRNIPQQKSESVHQGTNSGVNRSVLALNTNDMTIEYALTRTEVVTGFFRSLRSSPRYLAFLVICVLALFIVVPQACEGLAHPFAMRDAGSVVLGLCTTLVLLPLILFVRAKTTMRSLTISPEEISTAMASLNGRVAWSKIKIVQEKESFVLIASTSGNAFLIPNRAFANPEQKTEFVTKSQAWMTASRTLK